MKRSIFFLIASLASMQMLSAQSAYTSASHNVKKFWVDLQLGQQFGLDKWNNVAYANDGFPAASVTELRGTANLYLASPVFGAFLDVGLSVMPAPAMRSFSLDRVPKPNCGTQYYLRETVSQSGSDGASAHFRIAVGLFGDIRAGEKLNIMPYLGVGGFSMDYRSYDMVLKEQGSNMQYDTKFVWGGNGGDYDSSSGMLGYLTARLNFRYKLSPKLSFLAELEYSYFFDTLDFHARYSNTFNGNVQRSVTVEGNNMNMFGVTFGISFR